MIDATSKNVFRAVRLPRSGQVPASRQCGTDSVTPKIEKPERIKPLAIASAHFARYDRHRTAADPRRVFHKHLDVRGWRDILFQNDVIESGVANQAGLRRTLCPCPEEPHFRAFCL
jgi:hypothetical protein